ncbi:MAG: electron transfer flavoprotein subunit alpha/FixB family protein [Bacteroidia bacterium]|nr:electron transfer flavoprotein subunit alpha/FixB family protein [Bacteroidia bacterium]
MPVLIYAENTEGKFKKSAFEAVTYARAIADALNTSLCAISIGDASDDELGKLSKYGAKKVLKVSGEQFKNFSVQGFASAISEAAKKEDSDVIVMLASFGGRGIAPRLAVKLNAGLAEGVVDLPKISGGFIARKTAYSGKAFADVELVSAKKIITLIPNSYKVEEKAEPVQIENFSPAINKDDFKITVKETVRSSSKVSLPDAEIVVSGGRGLKGPENWGMIEELAEILGAATACSKPVSDANWRPHSEHVGQTGITIGPNVYIAIGISGAIQHLAGVSSSKVIVVINKDPEAPFFKAADYGIVGDAFEVVPKLIEAAKAFKAGQN